MRFEDANNLVLSRYCLAIKHASNGLFDDLLHQGEETLRLIGQDSGLLSSHSVRHLDNFLDLPHAFSRDLYQFLI